MESATRGQTPESARHSFRTAASRFACNTSEAAESPTVVVDDRIFVAVPEELKHGKSTLLWALQNLANASSRSMVFITHVHVPAQMITMGLGANVHYSTMRPQELRAYREHEREKMEKKLNEYVLICRRFKVNCDKAAIQNDDIAKGVIELIASHGITKLVMGAASDKNYSKAMRAPMSMTALKIMEGAASSCKIWFTCKGSLIFTRDANAGVPAVPSSPAATNTAPLPVSNTSSQMRSMMTNKLENQASSSNVSTMNDMGISRRDVSCSLSERAGGTLLQQSEDAGSTFNGNPRRPWDSEDFSVDSDISQNSGCSSSPNNGPVGIPRTAVVDNNDISEVGSSMHLSTNNSCEHILPAPHDLDKLKEALTEIQFLKNEVEQECNKRRNAERELHSALQKLSFDVDGEQEIMNDPHMAADGFTYEGEAIKGWLDGGHSTSPMTNLKLEHSLLVPNRALRSAILEWKQQEQH
nr:unnamed protein product [Digitaria exilis]